MKTLTLIVFFTTTLTIYAQDNTGLTEKIIRLEKTALERWNNGDIFGYLEITADDITYFDPTLKKRMDGLQNLTAYYKPIQGMIGVSDYDMINPKVQAVENMAVLTYNLKSHSKGKTYLWNCTEVYRKEKDGDWKIIQSHWSYTKPSEE